MKHLETHWATAIENLTYSSEAYVLVTLLGARGSTPRNSGTKMVVTTNSTYDTIGGGHLEYKAIGIAHELLSNSDNGAPENQQRLEHFPLGPSLGQCCGGSTSVLFESFIPTNINIAVFGAGHVAHALMTVLSSLPCNVKWIDSREDLFPEATAKNIHPSLSPYPVDEVKSLPANSYFLVLTHNHQLDFELCEAILKRGDAHYVGLIGSDTKWARFKKRFEFKGVTETSVNQIHCPVGLAEVSGKKPMEVAVSIAAEIIQHYQQNTAPTQTQQGLHWNELKPLLNEPNNENSTDLSVTDGAKTE